MRINMEMGQSPSSRFEECGKTGTERQAKISVGEWGMYKRIMELCIADPKELNAFLAAPDPYLSGKDNSFLNAFAEEIHTVHEVIAEKNSPDKFGNSDFLRWYIRQKKRYFFQSRKSRVMKGYFLIPILFELTSGCSVGCSFCCLEAGRLKKVFYYDDNATLWKDILQVVKEVLGDIAGAGGLYFATEPLDNPDYEYFLSDFHEMFGTYPQTTTAAADRNPDRTKRLLAQIGEEALRREAAVRFSVTSLEQLKRIHQLFSPQELAYVELLCNNPESSYEYCFAGRARALEEKLPYKRFVHDASCVCVNGFVINLCEGTIRIISPCLPDKIHPYGYLEFGRAEFTDAKDFRENLERLIENSMAEAFLNTARYMSENGVKWEYGQNRLKICGDGISRTLSVSEKEKLALHYVLKRQMPLNETVRLLEMNEFEEMRLMEKLKLFFAAGYIRACYQ